MKEHISRRSKAAGFKKSLLPEFSENQKKMLKGTFDYMGVNLYTANVAKVIANDTGSVSWTESMEAYTYQPSSWKNSASAWLKVRILLVLM